MNNDIWISTQGGLVKYNKKTGEKIYYNRANSNLPDNNLLSLFCNVNGDIWISGKHYGIGKFNDQQCTIYNQSNSGLPFDQLNTQIKLDKNGNVWIASLRWMTKFDGSNWKTWTTGSDISAWPLISGFDIDNNGVVWLYSTDGIGKIENEKYSVVSSIGSGLIAKNGNIKIDNVQNVWIAIENIGLYKYNGSTFTLYSTSNSCLPTNNIYAISFDLQNNVWLATAEGLVKFDISNCHLYKPPLPDTALLCLKPGNNDTIWCGSFSGKLLCFDGTDFTSIDLSNSPLMDNNVLDIIVDSNNNTWVATQKNVVKKTSNNFYSVFNKKGNAIAQDKDGAIWVAFGSGDTCLLKMDFNGNTVFDSINSPFNKKTIIKCLKVDNNNHLWAATNYGLFEYNGVSFANYNTENSDIPSNEIFEITFDKDNILWGGSSNGLFKFNGANWLVWNTENSAIPTNIVNGLYIAPNNKIWFSCMDEKRIAGIDYGGGLTCFDGQTMVTYNKSNSGLLANTIFGIYIDKNNTIWLATCGAGLMNFDTKDKWSAYNVTNSGIANNIVQGIKQDKSGNLWLGHIDAGISVFNPDSFQLSVDNINECNTSFVLFPNPVNDDLYIKFKTHNRKIIQARIYDLTGRLIFTLPNQEINQENSLIHFKIQNVVQNNQIYILKIICDTEQFSKKFLVEKK